MEISTKRAVIRARKCMVVVVEVEKVVFGLTCAHCVQARLNPGGQSGEQMVAKQVAFSKWSCKMVADFRIFFNVSYN